MNDTEFEVSVFTPKGEHFVTVLAPGESFEQAVERALGVQVAEPMLIGMLFSNIRPHLTGVFCFAVRAEPGKSAEARSVVGTSGAAMRDVALDVLAGSKQSYAYRTEGGMVLIGEPRSLGQQLPMRDAVGIQIGGQLATGLFHAEDTLFVDSTADLETVRATAEQPQYQTVVCAFATRKEVAGFGRMISGCGYTHHRERDGRHEYSKSPLIRNQVKVVTIDEALAFDRGTTFIFLDDLPDTLVGASFTNGDRQVLTLYGLGDVEQPVSEPGADVDDYIASRPRAVQPALLHLSSPDPKPVAKKSISRGMRFTAYYALAWDVASSSVRQRIYL